MAKRGGTKHLKRIAIPKAFPVKNKKEYTWMIQSSPGPHNKFHSAPLLILLRDLLGFAKTARDAKRILNTRLVSVDGFVRTDPAFPVGLFDVIHFSKVDKYYRVFVDHKGRLYAKEAEKSNADKKLLKVVGKMLLQKQR